MDSRDRCGHSTGGLGKPRRKEHTSARLGVSDPATKTAKALGLVTVPLDTGEHGLAKRLSIER
jgi:hypothetical protein